jgi:broad specificity phosphatase PhoE
MFERTLVVLRHGRTDRTFSGDTEGGRIPLNPVGIRQSEQRREAIEAYEFDAI